MSDESKAKDKLIEAFIAVLLSFPVSIWKWYVIQLYWNNIIAKFYEFVKIDIFMIGAIVYLISAIKGPAKQSEKEGIEIIIEAIVGCLILNISYFVFKGIIF